MTGLDKQNIAGFLALTDDYLCGGYKKERKEYTFSSAEPAACPVESRSSSNDSIEKIAEEIKICKKCALSSKRTNTAPGEGCLTPLVMVIGEGPGEEEDKQGRPFVGRAGQLLDKMLASINLSRNTNSFIANVVKCRPPNNRNPHPEEIQSCAGFLERQITLLKPKFILAAGKVSANTLLKTTQPIGTLRGKFTELCVGGDSYPLLVTYHPSALLRDESLKRPAWEDLKLLRTKLPDKITEEN